MCVNDSLCQKKQTAESKPPTHPVTWNSHSPTLGYGLYQLHGGPL